jgi:hypothetical protein
VCPVVINSFTCIDAETRIGGNPSCEGDRGNHSQQSPQSPRMLLTKNSATRLGTQCHPYFLFEDPCYNRLYGRRGVVRAHQRQSAIYLRSCYSSSSALSTTTYTDTSYPGIVIDHLDGIFPCATYLQMLTIIDSSNFSIAALQRFVESGLHLPPGPAVAPRSDTGHLSGDVPSISEMDRAWFEANVHGFRHD